MGKLRDVHEAIAGKTLEKDTFRRAMDPHLRGTGTLSSGTVGRPSQRFRRAR
jgi:8-oxo-dGTP diphosphatase